MTPDWIEEGCRQLSLALLWERHARALETSARQESQPEEDDRLTLAAAIREQVVSQAVREAWLPGAAQTVKWFREKWEEKGESPDGADIVALGKRLSSVLERALAREETAGARPSRTTVEDSLKAALDFMAWAIKRASSEEWDSDASPEMISKGVLLAPPPRKSAAATLALAAALAAWRGLAPRSRRLTDAEVTLARIPHLARECGEIRAWIKEWRDGQLAFGPFLAGSGPLRHRLGEAAECLQSCRDALIQLSPSQHTSGEEHGLRDRRESFHQIEVFLARMPDDWPPGVFAELQSEWSRSCAALASAVADASDLVRDREGTPEAMLAVLALADQASAAGSAVEEADWNALQLAATRLLGAPGAYVSIVRTSNAAGDAACVELNPSLPAGQAPSLRSVGLMITRSGQVQVIRQARFVVGERIPEVVPLLHMLAKRLDDERSPESTVFADLFRQVAGDLRGYADLTTWWAAAQSPSQVEQLGRFWQSLQLVEIVAVGGSTASHVARALLAHLFDSRTFEYVPASTLGDGAKLWNLVPWKETRDVVAIESAPKFALKGPDGHVLQPGGWLRVPETWSNLSHPSRVLREAAPLIEGLKALDPDWSGWKSTAALAWNLAFGGTGDAPGDIHPKHARAAFQAAYDRASDPDDQLAAPWGQLARRLYLGLTSTGMEFIPALYPKTLAIITPAGGFPEGTRFRWVPGKTSNGTNQRVVHFGVGTAPPELELTLSTQTPDELIAWINWVQSPHSAARQGEPPALRDWRTELPRCLLDLKEAARKSADYRKLFLGWCETAEGRGWFDQLAHEGLAVPPVASASALLAALRSGNWCEPHPPVDVKKQVCRWPRGVATTDPPEVTWKELPGLELGEIRIADVQFAPQLARVKGEFSLGRPAPGSALAAAEALRKELSRFSSLILLLDAPIAALRRAEIDAAMGAQTSEPVVLIRPLLDAFMSAGRQPGAALAEIDAVLTRSRAWAQAHQLRILPASWTFASPVSIEQLTGEGLEVPAPEFVAAAPARSVVLASLGWSGAPGTPARPARLTLSAGAAPKLYEELRAQLERLSHWPPAARLRDALNAWPRHQLESTDALRFAAERFFAAFWEAAGPRPHQNDVAEAADLLERLLRENYRLESFYPSTTRDFSQDWLQIRESGNARTGRVVRVHRPGLRCPGEGLSFQALVDVE